MNAEFEIEVCSRCAGTGKFSYCQMYGDRCFKCRGKGKTYTKRGQAAIDYGRSLRTVPVSEIQVGWFVWQDDLCFGSHKPGWYEVTAISESSSKYGAKDADGTEVWHPYIEITTAVAGQCVFSTSILQAIPNKARLMEVRQLALEYQDTLTKQGAPRKRAA